MLDLGVEILKVIEVSNIRVPSIIIKNILYTHCLLQHTSTDFNRVGTRFQSANRVLSGIPLYFYS